MYELIIMSPFFEKRYEKKTERKIASVKIIKNNNKEMKNYKSTVKEICLNYSIINDSSSKHNPLHMHA